jgi:flagellar biosynthetic protein FliR
MADLIALVAQHRETFLLVLFRLGGMMAFAPVLGHRGLPVAHRAGLVVLLAAVLTPVLGPPPAPIDDGVRLVLAVAGEVFVGLAIGFVAQLAITAVVVAGELIGVEMGLGIAAIYDASMGQQITVLSRFLQFMALLLFVTANGHHVLLQAVAVSFQRVRPGAVLLQQTTSAGVVSLGGKLFRAGLELAAPVVAILFVANVGLAIVARVAPQMNVFVLGIPLTIGLGLFGIVQTFPRVGSLVTAQIDEMARDIAVLFGGGLHGLR